MSDLEAFYVPTRDMFAHPYAWELYIGYAADLQAAGLVRSFPSDIEVRNCAIELLAERHAVEDVVADLRHIADAIVEAVAILEARARRKGGG